MMMMCEATCVTHVLEGPRVGRAVVGAHDTTVTASLSAALQERLEGLLVSSGNILGIALLLLLLVVVLLGRRRAAEEVVEAFLQFGKVTGGEVGVLR